MSERFFDMLARIDAVVAAGPAACDFNRDVEPFLQEEASREYFYDSLHDPAWLDVLIRADKFREVPEPNARWPESGYLARIATHAPHRVLQIILQIPYTENISVHEDLVDAALQMPIELAHTWAKRETRWVEERESLGHVLPEKIGTLVANLGEGDQVDTALELARALLTLLPRPRFKEKEFGDETYSHTPEPQARFDTWDYEQILQRNMPPLVGVAGQRALSLMCDLLDSAIRLSHPQGADEGSENYSYIWRHAIEDHEQNQTYGLRDLLVSAVRDATEQIARRDSTQVPSLIEYLEGRRPSRQIFDRIALHVLRVFAESAPRLVAERLTDRRRFDDIGVWHEYALLARDRFTYLEQKDQAKVLGWIERGPDFEEFKARGEEAITGRQLTREQFERFAKGWKLKRLAPLRDALPLDWRQRYDVLVEEVGEPEYPEFISYSRSWVGPTSPKSAVDLRSMNIEEIIRFLRSWERSDDFMSPSPEGLGRVLTEIVGSDPERFAAASDRFQELDPTYVRAFVSGLRDAAKNQRAFPWSSVLDLCLWVVNQPRDIPERTSEYADLDPGWGWTRKSIADLLSTGFQAEAAEIPFDLRTSAWAVLSPITEDPDPTPDDEARYGGPNMDPATFSINTARGEAMHAVVRYALWVRRHIERVQDSKERVACGLDEMAEVRDVLEVHLDIAHDPSLAIRAVYGQWFPWLVLLDERWARSVVPRIFSPEEQYRDLADAAWETYIIFCHPYDSVFEVLREQYGRAVEHIGATRADRRRLADPDERLAEHLMIFYWRGKLQLDDQAGLLAKFYAKAFDALRAHALDFVGQSLRNTKEAVEPQILDRLLALWNERFSTVRSAKPPVSDMSELVAFGSWFASEKFDDGWAFSQLMQVLRLTGKTEPDRAVVKRLEELSSAMPRECVECLRLMVEGEKGRMGIYGWRASARQILSTALQSSDDDTRQAALALVHRLGEQGHLDFRDLLSQLRS